MSTLFPETIAPASSEPPVWIRRLVILQSIDPEPIVIRDIPFELGLNIVCTRQPPAGSTEALGHDVGKTLLTRLLRYILGEETFAEGRTRAAIRRVLPDSYVAAEVRVAGQSWSILRHLGAPAANPSRAGLFESWHDLLGTAPDPQSYPQFLVAVSDTVLESVESPLLTHAKRPVGWLDVLAWIARDQKCRYAHPLVWRHRDTETENGPLHVEDASTVLRCVAGLMSARERELFEAHDTLLARRQSLERELEGLRSALDAEDGIIDDDLRQFLNVDDIAVNELAPAIIGNRVSQLRGLRQQERQRLNLDELRDAFDEAVQNRAETVAEQRHLSGYLATVERQLSLRRTQQPSQTIYDHFLSLCDRPVDDCPAKMKIATQQLPDPYREEEIARLEAERQAVQSRLDEVRAQLPDLEQAMTAARSVLRSVDEEFSTIASGIDGRIALHDAMLRRVQRHLTRFNRRSSITTEHGDLTTQIQQSSEEQRMLRESLTVSREWLSTRFHAICQLLLGGTRMFEVAIEAKAIRLHISDANGAPGEATSTSALVLSLDLATMQSALDGFGHHPRLALLDSPREADMEIEIFQRFIGLLSSWHMSPTRTAFQIIMTTTTRPDSALLPDGVVRLELARVPESETLFGRNL